MRDLLDRINGPLHLVAALAGAWLVATSPWIGMYAWIPDEPGFFDLGHIGVGLLGLVVGVVYLIACTLGGRWRLYFPWLAGQVGALGGDVAGIFRGQRPMSEGGGLFAVIEGLLLVALLAAGITGAVWLALAGTDAARAWHGYHVFAARAFAGALLLHLVGVSLHLIDLVRD